MGEEQRQALARLLAQDEAFKTELASAISIEDAVRIAREHGVEASEDDFTPPEGAELSDADLEVTSGGTFVPVHVPATFPSFCPNTCAMPQERPRIS